MVSPVLLLILFFSMASASAVDESSGFLPIRPDGQMFYWLMRTKNTTHDYKSFPLVMYMAGGPGDGSSGYSNFAEVGPHDVHLKERKDSWLKHANLLFFDHPIGCGYSFVSDGGQFCRNQSMIDADFMQALKLFLQKHPEFKTIPSYIFGESYGGKYAVGAAVNIHKQQMEGKLEFNLKAIGLGASWIHPMVLTKSWPDYLYGMSLIDMNDYQDLNDQISEIDRLFTTGEKEAAADLWLKVYYNLPNMTLGADQHNVMGRPFDQDSVVNLMNSRDVKDRLSIPDNIIWGKQDWDVLRELRGDDLTPIVEEVEYVLNQTDIKVVVWSGQLDATVPAIGVQSWVNALKWGGSKGFADSRKQLLFKEKDGQPLVYFREHGNLSLYSFLKAGHNVPLDQISASLAMLQRVIKG